MARGRSHRSLTHAVLAVLAALPLAAFAAGCGGDDEGGDASKGEPTGEAKRGGTLTVMSNGDVDFVDPGAAYYQFTFIFTYAAHRPLYSYEPDQTTKASPDLAEGAPQVSADGRTITVKIKKGVRFSPPVNREVTSEDVKYAIERGFSTPVSNGYATAYLGDLEGAPKDAQKRAPDIAGIETPDPSTIVFRLERPTSQAVIGALSLPLSAPVPREYAERYDRDSPSTYGEHQVATGPYMIRNDRSGKTVGYDPGKRIELVRNPNWSRDTDYRPAYLDRIVFDEGNADPVSASRQILNGNGLVNGQGDFNPPPQILKQTSTGSQRSQLIVGESTGRVRYVSINTKIAPFDDPNVRKALSAIANREAYRLAMGGRAAGDIPTHYISPGISGFEEAGGLPGPGLDFLAKPAGDPAIAANYMKKAGYETGRYDGDERFLMVADNSGPTARQAESVLNDFQKLGFRFNFRQVPHDTMYTKFCNVPKQKVAICPSTGWQKDFPDPVSVLDPTFNGENIVPVNNSNWPQLDDPEINGMLEDASLETDPKERARLYGEIDKKITAAAPAVPWLWDKALGLQSKNVRGVLNKFNAAWDLSFTSLK